MGSKTRYALNRLSDSIRENTAQIEALICKVGIKPDPALVFTAAKYFEALNKLSEE